MKKLESFFSRHKILAAALIFGFFIILDGCFFPICNLTRERSRHPYWYAIIMALSLYGCWGNMENAIFPKAKLLPIAVLNLGLTLGGMLFRFLLEFGEVSNTYNFTPPNMALHIAVAVIVSTLSWYWSKHRKS